MEFLKITGGIFIASSNAGGVAATAGKCIGGADVIGGKGKHECSYDNGTYKWKPNNTTIGTVKDNASEL